MDNNLVIEKISSVNPDEQFYASANSLIDSIYASIKGFEKEAINAGREFSSHRMNQCIAVSIYGISIMDELKTLVLFAALTYAAFVLCRIAKRFPKKA